MTLSQKCCRGTVQTTTSHVCSHSNSYNWRHHVRSSLKDALNSSIFICHLNAMYDLVVLTDAGRAFQACTAATGNARSPSVVHRVVGTSSLFRCLTWCGLFPRKDVVAVDYVWSSTGSAKSPEQKMLICFLKWPICRRTSWAVDGSAQWMGTGGLFHAREVAMENALSPKIDRWVGETMSVVEEYSTRSKIPNLSFFWVPNLDSDHAKCVGRIEV